jgi:hypothetical protein
MLPLGAYCDYQAPRDSRSQEDGHEKQECVDPYQPIMNQPMPSSDKQDVIDTSPGMKPKKVDVSKLIDTPPLYQKGCECDVCRGRQWDETPESKCEMFGRKKLHSPKP